MEQKKTLLRNGNETKEVETAIRAFRLLSGEEQRIAYAVLEGMNLQKRMEEQRETAQSI